MHKRYLMSHKDFFSDLLKLHWRERGPPGRTALGLAILLNLLRRGCLRMLGITWGIHCFEVGGVGKHEVELVGGGDSLDVRRGSFAGTVDTLFVQVAELLWGAGCNRKTTCESAVGCYVLTLI